MKYLRWLFCLGVMIQVWSQVDVFAQGTAFTYQGHLLVNSAAANGTFDLRFQLHPSSSGTNITGTPFTNSAVSVTNGLFTVILDFGNVFGTSPLYLEIDVRTNSSSGYTALSPVQLLTSAPYAVQALNSVNAVNSYNFVGTIADSQLSTNVALLDTNLTFRNQVTFSNATGYFSGTGTGTFSGMLVGNGGLITNVNATNLVGVVQSNPTWQIIQSTNQQAAAGNNYLATNAASTTLVLPASPGVGSVVQIAGSGANGWKVSTTGFQSVLTETIGLPAGQNWGVAYNNSQSWRALGCSSNGIRIAAGYATGVIYYTADGGATWTSSGSDSQAWSSIASSADGMRMVAAPNNNNAYVYTSVNGGMTWTKQSGASALAGVTIHSVASSADGLNLVAAVASGAGYIYTSSNGGTNWTARTNGYNWSQVACSDDGTIIAAAPYNGPIFVSQNSGATWTTNGPSTYWSAIACSASGSKMVATVYSSSVGYIYTSGDRGATWTPRYGPQNWTNVVSSDNGMNLAASSTLGYIYTSTDSGQTWLQRTNNLPSGTQAWSAMCCSASGGRLLAAISTGLIYGSVSATTAGTNGYLMGNQYASAGLQYIGNNQWMPLNFAGVFSSF